MTWRQWYNYPKFQTCTFMGQLETSKNERNPSSFEECCQNIIQGWKKNLKVAKPKIGPSKSAFNKNLQSRFQYWTLRSP